MLDKATQQLIIEKQAWLDVFGDFTNAPNYFNAVTIAIAPNGQALSIDKDNCSLGSFWVNPLPLTSLYAYYHTTFAYAKAVSTTIH